MKIKKWFFVLCFSFFYLFAFSQKIASVQLFNPDQKYFNSSIFELGSNFTFVFDDLAEKTSTYYYTITHHNANWEKSSLFPAEYIKGSQQIYITNFINSFNTNANYRHYEFSIPNKNLQLLVTGNYIINIFKTTDTKNPIIQRKFCLYQNTNPLGLSIFRDINSGKFNQRIQVEFDHKSLLMNELYNVKLFTIQNNNYNTLKEIKNPFVLGDKIIFNGNNQAFDAGNEYYSFDTKIINIAGFSTYKIEKTNNQTHVYLVPNTKITNTQYDFRNDINGGFLFRSLDLVYEYDANQNADYIVVHFKFLSDSEIENPIFIVGAFNNWEAKEENKMQYNPETKMYELALFLKQGYYNYIFATKNQEQLDFSELNNSYWQTENNYKSLLYFRPFGARYDQLIGFGEYKVE